MPRFYGLRLTLGRRDFATVLGSSGPRHSNGNSSTDLKISKKQKKSPGVAAVMTLHVTPLSTASTSSTATNSTECDQGSGVYRASFPASSFEASCDGAGEAQLEQPYSTTKTVSRSSFSAESGIGSSMCSGAPGSSPVSLRKFATPMSSRESGSGTDGNNVAAFEDRRARENKLELEDQDEKGDAGAQNRLHTPLLRRRSCSIISVESEPVPIPQQNIQASHDTDRGRTSIDEDGWVAVNVGDTFMSGRSEPGCIASSPPPSPAPHPRRLPTTPNNGVPAAHQYPDPSPTSISSVFRYPLPQSPPLDGETARWDCVFPADVVASNLARRRASRTMWMEQDIHRSHSRRTSLMTSSVDYDDDSQDDDQAYGYDSDGDDFSGGSAGDEMDSSEGLMFELEL